MKMNFLTIVCTTIISLLFSGVEGQAPEVFIMDAGRLMELKAKVKEHDAASLELVSNLKNQADRLLEMKPLSVTDKNFTPESANKHDYMSQAPYYWYDSSKTNGLPYLRKDGQRNPEINKITDHRFLGEIDNACRILSVAWFLTGKEKYAEKAGSLLRYWFFNEATKMNPNLNYGQAIPGINSGRGIGIIETISLTGIADAAGLLQGAPSWTDTDTHSLKQWYEQFLDWLLTSKNGKEEHAARNNHGTWFYVQAVDFALFTGNKAKARELVEESKARIEGQIDAEGKMQLELDRTNGLGYSTFNLLAWFRLAKLAEFSNIDLWTYKNKEGASIRTALDWLIPYALGNKKWTYQQIGNYKKDDMFRLLLLAANKYKGTSYSDRTSGYKIDSNDPMTEIMYGKSK